MVEEPKLGRTLAAVAHQPFNVGVCFFAREEDEQGIYVGWHAKKSPFGLAIHG
jgi:hypothetical protein